MNGKNGLARALLASVTLCVCLLLTAGYSYGDGTLTELRPDKDSVILPKDTKRITLNTNDLNNLAVTPATMVNNLLGLPIPGVTVANIVWVGANRAGGEYTDTVAAIGIPDGIVMSSGNILTGEDNVPFWNDVPNTSFRNGRPGDLDVAAISLVPTNDAAILEFDVTSAAFRLLRFKYVFGSEEYDDWAPPPWIPIGFNDGFGIWEGPAGARVNKALIPPFGAGAVPVTIWNVNNGANRRFYADNDCNIVGPGYPCDPVRQTELDGLTQLLGNVASRVPFYVRPGPGPSTWPARPIPSRPVALPPEVPVHIKIAIADARDSALDSVVFLKAWFSRGICWACPPAGFVCTEDVALEDCTGEWVADGLCIDVASGCGDGACDLGDSCTETSEVVCEDAAGLYAGEGSTCSDPTGACCEDDGTCVEVMAVACATLQGTYQDDGTTCTPAGACVMGDGTCMETSEACCDDVGGTYSGDDTTCEGGACCSSSHVCSMVADEENCGGEYQGDGTICSGDICGEHDIPTVSEWGLVVMLLLVLAAGTVVLMRRRAMTA